MARCFDGKMLLKPLFLREWCNMANLWTAFDATFTKLYLKYCYLSGIPETPDVIDVPAEIHSDEVALKWSKLSNNGADITQYTVYIRDVNSNGTVGDWRTLEVIFDVFAREYVVTLKKGQQYDLLVTATNQYGESLKEQHNIKRIRVLGGTIRKKIVRFHLRVLVLVCTSMNSVAHRTGTRGGHGFESR